MMSDVVEDNVTMAEDFIAGMPKPLYWRILVMPIAPKKTSSGGILLAEQTQEAEAYLANVGQLVAIGDGCWKDQKFDGMRLPEVGEWVMWAKHAGQKIEYRGVKFTFLNDDNLLATAPNPEALKVYV